MTTRLKTRIGAGAALVTGIGMLCVATAPPSQADTTATYTCTVAGSDGSMIEEITVTFDTNAPETVDPGETLTVDSVTSAATLPLAGAPSPADGAAVTVPITAPWSTGDTVVGTVATTLTSQEIAVGSHDVRVSLASAEEQSVVVPIEAAGQTFEVLVPESFEATLTGFTAGAPVTVSCSTTETDSVIDTIVVTSPEMDEEPNDAEDTAEEHDPGDATTPVADPLADEPAVPQVVQTDGLTPRMLPTEDHSVGYALGGLLLAGGGAATVLVVRRRAQEH